MSLRIAVALVATIGAGLLTATTAEARPDMVDFRGDYSPGTIVVKTNERRLYLVVGSGHAVVELRQKAHSSTRRVQDVRQLRRPAPALDVPGHDAQPARQCRRWVGVPLCDLVQAGGLLQEPAVQILVSDAGRPAGPCVLRRGFHGPSLPPRPQRRQPSQSPVL